MNAPIRGVAHMMRRALNTLDYRLMDHGERVAYILFQFFEADGIYTPAQLKEICYLGMFHDIGAYKTELVDSLVDSNTLFRFEIGQTMPHSIYSYLFLKECDFFEEFIDAILFHHFPYSRLLKTDCKNKTFAARIFLADKLDILFMRGAIKTPEDAYKHLNNSVFSPQEVENLKQLEHDKKVLTKVISNKYLDELFGFLNKQNLTEMQISQLTQMLPYTIDFRSESTVTHTVATVQIAMTLAELFHLNAKQQQDIYYGALLHDIGKISVSLMILEKESALSKSEYSVMQDHVLLSEYILKGHVSSEVLHIAIRHHEKLDGSGYPYGLTADDLNLSERIVAVADILSALMGKRSYKDPFPEEKVKSIVKSMADQGKLCSKVINKALDHYSLLSEKVEKNSNDMISRYFTIEHTAKELLEKYIHFG